MDELVGYGVFPELMQSSREKGLLPKLLDPEVKYGEFSLDLYFSPFRKGQIETIVKLAKEERIDSDLEQKIEEAKIRIFWELNAHIAHLGLVLYNATALRAIRQNLDFIERHVKSEDVPELSDLYRKRVAQAQELEAKYLAKPSSVNLVKILNEFFFNLRDIKNPLAYRIGAKHYLNDTASFYSGRINPDLTINEKSEVQRRFYEEECRHKGWDILEEGGLISRLMFTGNVSEWRFFSIEEYISQMDLGHPDFQDGPVYFGHRQGAVTYSIYETGTRFSLSRWGEYPFPGINYKHIEHLRGALSPVKLEVTSNSPFRLLFEGMISYLSERFDYMEVKYDRKKGRLYFCPKIELTALPSGNQHPPSN